MRFLLTAWSAFRGQIRGWDHHCARACADARRAPPPFFATTKASGAVIVAVRAFSAVDELGYRADQARWAAERCADMPAEATLEERVQAALRLFLRK